MKGTAKDSKDSKGVIKAIKTAMAFSNAREFPSNLEKIKQAARNYYSKDGELDLTKYPNGEKVEYVGDIDSQVMEYLSRGISENRSISSVILPGDKMSEQAKEIFGSHLMNSKNLKNVHLGGAINSDKSASIMGIAFSENRSLESADISGSEFSTNSVKQFAEFLGDNEKLSLEAEGLQEEFAEKIKELSGKEVRKRKVSWEDRVVVSKVSKMSPDEQPKMSLGGVN